VQLFLTEESCRVQVAGRGTDEANARNERDRLQRERDDLVQDKLNLLHDFESSKHETERWKAAVSILISRL